MRVWPSDRGMSKKYFTATNHGQQNETDVSMIFLLYQWDYIYHLLECNSEQKTNLGNTNQLLEELVFLHEYHSHTGMLLSGVGAEVHFLSWLSIANSITKVIQIVLIKVQIEFVPGSPSSPGKAGKTSKPKTILSRLAQTVLFMKKTGKFAMLIVMNRYSHRC